MEISEIWEKSGFLDDESISFITEKMKNLEDNKITKDKIIDENGNITLPIVYVTPPKREFSMIWEIHD